MDIHFNITKLLILVAGIIVSTLIAVYVPLTFLGILIGGVIGFFVYPRFNSIKSWLKDAINEGGI